MWLFQYSLHSQCRSILVFVFTIYKNEMNKIFLLFEQFSFWELAVYALMYGVLIAFLIAGVKTLVKFVKEIVCDSKFV